MNSIKKLLKTIIGAVAIAALCTSFIAGIPCTGNAQGVGINSLGNGPDSSAGLDVDFTDKGTLITRMTSAQRDAIASPATGLLIFNTDCNTFSFNAGTPEAPNWTTLNSGNALVAAVTISASPTGPVCEGTSITYTATPSGGLTSPSFQWKVNGENAGTDSPTYTTDDLENGDLISCVLSADEPCVSGSPATSNIITQLVNASPAITGTIPAATCGAGVVSLSATASSGTINWYAAAAEGVSLGTGTSYSSSISATTDFYVDATFNGCTTPVRTPVTATVFTGSPQQPDEIAGTAFSLGGLTTIYTISAVDFATSYVWTVPSGATITGGQGTTSISVNFGCSVSGTISVVTSNVCGSSQPRTLSVDAQLTTGPIYGPNYIWPNATGIVYSVASDPNATYQWSVPAGASIVAGGGNSITVNFGASPSGTISVSLTTSCGTSVLSTTPIILNASPLSIIATGTTTWTPPPGVTSVEYLIVGGGGGGGRNTGGGGGAGGVLAGTIAVASATLYPVNVGAGGLGGTQSGSTSSTSGQNSSFNSLIAYGGGAGGDEFESGSPGGSGGGGGWGSAFGAGVPGQGNNGGTGGNGTPNYTPGSGGGAGAAGATGITAGGTTAAIGGIGVSSSITGTATYYGGGGAGGQDTSRFGTTGAGTGGLGGGGNSSTTVVGHATPNTGGGGGGGCNQGPTWSLNGGNGGSGIVILKY